jgi:hypothetical protein
LNIDPKNYLSLARRKRIIRKVETLPIDSLARRIAARTHTKDQTKIVRNLTRQRDLTVKGLTDWLL